MEVNTSRPSSVTDVLGSRASGSADSAIVRVPPFFTARVSAAAPEIEGLAVAPPPEQAVPSMRGSAAIAATSLRGRYMEVSLLLRWGVGTGQETRCRGSGGWFRSVRCGKLPA